MITSTGNPRVKAATALHRRKERDAQGRYLIEGPRFVADALARAPEDVIEVFATAPVPHALATATEDAGIPLTLVSDDVLVKLTDSVTPQGVVAVAHQRRANLADAIGHGFVIVLHEVSDPANAGAVVRTAAAAGASAVVLTGGSVDPWHPKAVRAAAGTTTVTRLVVGVDGGEVLAACRAAGQRTVALDPSTRRSVFEAGLLASPVALVFGSESHGLPAEVLEAVDAIVAVPLYGPVESLNLAAAVAVTAYAAAGSAQAMRGEFPPAARERNSA